mgnify:CR=1 FL=1|jgi:hypothetical protein
MARHEQELLFNSKGPATQRAVIPDVGTLVTVEYFSGAGWVPDSASPLATPNSILCKGISVRLTPNVGGFFIDEGISS